MYYVYILRSLADETKRYTGFTKDLKNRIVKHRKGDVSYTSKFRSWKIHTYIAFSSEEKARSFERYLKSHSGSAF